MQQEIVLQNTIITVKKYAKNVSTVYTADCCPSLTYLKVNLYILELKTSSVQEIRNTSQIVKTQYYQRQGRGSKTPFVRDELITSQALSTGQKLVSKCLFEVTFYRKITADCVRHKRKTITCNKRLGNVSKASVLNFHCEF